MINLKSFFPQFPRKLYLLSAFLYMCGIFYLSSLKINLPDSGYPLLRAFVINFCHCPLYAGLGFLLLLGFATRDSSGQPIPNKLTIFLSMAVLSFYGVFDEFHQSWSGRTPSIYDLFTDIFGGFLGVISLNLLYNNKTSIKPFYFLILITLILSLFFSGLATFE